MAGRLRSSSLAQGGRPRLGSQASSPAAGSSPTHMSPEDEAKLYAFMAEEVDSLTLRLKRGEVAGSTRTGLLTVDLLLHAVNKGEFRDVAQVLVTLRAIGRRLVRARPIELTVGNVVRQALFTVRQENKTFLRAQAEGGFPSCARVGVCTQHEGHGGVGGQLLGDILYYDFRLTLTFLPPPFRDDVLRS